MDRYWNRRGIIGGSVSINLKKIRMAQEIVSNSKNNTQQGELGLRDLILSIRNWIGYLWSKKWVIILFGLLGGALGLGYAFLKKPVYTATTTFVLETGEKGGGLSQYAGLAAMVGIDLAGGGGGLFQGENILELYRSRTMISKTLLSEADINGKKQLLIDRFIDGNKMRKGWKKPKLKNIKFAPDNTYENPTQQLLHDSIISVIVKAIDKGYLMVGKPDKKLNIINVSVQSTDEQFAKAFNEKIVQNVNDFYLQTKTKRAKDNVAILQQKTDSVRGVMTGAIYRAAEAIDATPNLNPTRQVQRIAPIQTSQASAEVNKVMLGQLIQNLELSKIALQKETPLIQIVDKPVLPLEKDQVGKKIAIVIGGLLGGLFVLVFLIIKKIVQNSLKCAVIIPSQNKTTC
jgi:uncharacterized protein involved in exopolysaccharide biosynthesis